MSAGEIASHIVSITEAVLRPHGYGSQGSSAPANSPFANIFANELFVTIINNVVLISTT